MLSLPTTFISVMAVFAPVFSIPFGSMSKFSSREPSSPRDGGPLRSSPGDGAQHRAPLSNALIAS